MVGQSLLARYAGFSYTGGGARAEFDANIRRKNLFFETVGKLPPPTTPIAAQLEALGHDKAFARLRDSAAREKWV